LPWFLIGTTNNTYQIAPFANGRLIFGPFR